MEKEKAAAVLTIKNANDFSEQGAKDVAAWLRRQAKHLLEGHKLYASRYRARYLYVEDGDDDGAT